MLPLVLATESLHWSLWLIPSLRISPSGPLLENLLSLPSTPKPDSDLSELETHVFPLGLPSQCDPVRWTSPVWLGDLALPLLGETPSLAPIGTN